MLSCRRCTVEEPDDRTLLEKDHGPQASATNNLSALTTPNALIALGALTALSTMTALSSVHSTDHVIFVSVLTTGKIFFGGAVRGGGGLNPPPLFSTVRPLYGALSLYAPAEVSGSVCRSLLCKK